ncbi:MAG: hypothetical protein GX195_07715 [Firmicutes bacterium]|jgi:hypothetical protein|nr:hypothetical protein [Bacillota bacterium]
MVRLWVLFLVLAMAAVPAISASDVVFVDPMGLFQTSIPREWVYQAQQSREGLSVFYGPGNHNLVYFEILEPVTYSDAGAFLDYVATMLAGPGGLEGFQIEEGPKECIFHAEEAASVTYSFKAGGGHRQKEYRLIVLVGENRAVSITISDAQESFAATKLALETVFTEWRWLF